MIVKSTRELLADSFRELAEKKPIKKITVKNITDNCGMAPATFYRHFQSKYDLLIWDYNQCIGSIMDEICEEQMPWNDVQLLYIHLYEKNKPFYLNLLRTAYGDEMFGNQLLEVGEKYILVYLKEVKKIETPDPDTSLYLRIYLRSAAYITREWMLGAIKEEGEKFAAVLNNTLPHPIRTYVFG